MLRSIGRKLYLKLNHLRGSSRELNESDITNTIPERLIFPHYEKLAINIQAYEMFPHMDMLERDHKDCNVSWKRAGAISSRPLFLSGSDSTRQS